MKAVQIILMKRIGQTTIMSDLNDIYQEIVQLQETLSILNSIDNLIHQIDMKLSSIENKLDNLEKINLEKI